MLLHGRVKPIRGGLATWLEQFCYLFAQANDGKRLRLSQFGNDPAARAAMQKMRRQLREQRREREDKENSGWRF